MCNEPFTIFGEQLPPYFSMLVLGFATAIFLGARWAKRAGYDHDTIIDTGLVSLIAGIAGARLLHVVADGYFWDYVHLCTDYTQVEWRITRAQCDSEAVQGAWDAIAGVCRPTERDCFAWAAFWQGGLTYYGGLILAAPTCLWFLRREGFPLLKAVDLTGFAIPIGLFFGRLGCFLGGCCFGVVTDHPFGLRFPPWSPASEAQWRAGILDAPHVESLPVHPTQLYESLGCLGIAAALMLWVNPRKRFDGQVMLAFLGSYAVLRFVLEFWRADDRGGVLGLSTSQHIGVLAIALVAYLWLTLRERTAELLAAPVDEDDDGDEDEDDGDEDDGDEDDGDEDDGDEDEDEDGDEDG